MCGGRKLLLHEGSKAERDSIFEKSRNRADTFDQVG